MIDNGAISLDNLNASNWVHLLGGELVTLKHTNGLRRAVRAVVAALNVDLLSGEKSRHCNPADLVTGDDVVGRIPPPTNRKRAVARLER